MIRPNKSSQADPAEAEVWTDRERLAWAPRPEMSVSEWASRHLYLRRGTTSMPGLYRPEFTPYVLEPLDCFTDDAIREIVICWGTQTGKTTILFACLGYGIAWDPGPSLLVMPAGNVCNYTSKNRIQPLIRDCPEMIEKMEPESRWKLQEMSFDGGVLSLVGANSAAQLASRPTRYLFLDEIEKYPAHVGQEAAPEALAEERTAAYPASKIVSCSTPVLAGGPILAKLERSDGRRYWVPCPRCGEFLILDFRRLRWDHDEEGKSVAPDDAAASAWYECEHCSGRIEEADKRAMIDGGRWVRRAQRIDRKGRIQGKAPRNTVAGFGPLNSLNSPFVTWGELVAKWLKSQEDQGLLQNFVNSVLVEAWKKRTIAASDEKLAENVWREMPALAVPDGFEVITAAADVQLAFVRWSVWAWRADGARHLVEYGEFAGIAELETVSSASYKCGGRELGVAMMLVDSGYRTTDVYNFCRGRRNVMACKGTPSNARGNHSTTVLDKYPDGKAIPGGLRLMSVFVDAFKDELHDRLGRVSWPAAERVPKAGAQADPPEQFVSFHALTGPDFLLPLTAEQRVEVTDKRGQVHYEWRRLRADNHYFDTAVYAAAAWSYIRPSWEISRKRRKTRRPAEPAAGSASKIRTKY